MLKTTNNHLIRSPINKQHPLQAIKLVGQNSIDFDLLELEKALFMVLIPEKVSIPRRVSVPSLSRFYSPQSQKSSRSCHKQNNYFKKEGSHFIKPPQSPRTGKIVRFKL